MRTTRKIGSIYCPWYDGPDVRKFNTEFLGQMLKKHMSEQPGIQGELGDKQKANTESKKLN